jgi:hypothetical protein
MAVRLCERGPSGLVGAAGAWPATRHPAGWAGRDARLATGAGRRPRPAWRLTAGPPGPAASRYQWSRPRAGEARRLEPRNGPPGPRMTVAGRAARHSPWSARRPRSLSDRTCILMTGSSHHARTCVLIESCHRLPVPRHCGQPAVFRRRRPGRRAPGAVLARARRGPRRPRDRRQLAGADILGPPAASCLADSSFWSGPDPETHAFDRPHARGEG